MKRSSFELARVALASALVAGCSSSGSAPADGLQDSGSTIDATSERDADEEDAGAALSDGVSTQDAPLDQGGADAGLDATSTVEAGARDSAAEASSDTGVPIDASHDGTTADGAFVRDAASDVTSDVVSDAPDGASLAGQDSGLDASTNSCDQVTDVSPTGANPNGPWSYGWSSALSTAFTLHTEYFASLNLQTAQMVDAGLGPSAWTSGTLGGQLDPGAFFNGTGMVYVVAAPGGTGTLQPNQLMLHPGPSGQYSIARWTAPRTETVQIQVTFSGLTSNGTSTTTDDHVRHNGADFTMGAGSLNLGGAPNTFSFSHSVDVTASDTLDFAVGDGGNGYSFDWTGVSAKICYAISLDGG
jgi:hypothetical protein